MLSLLFKGSTGSQLHHVLKFVLCSFIILCIIVTVTGCSTPNSDSAFRVSDYYSGLTTMNVLVGMTAEFDDYSVDFELVFKYNSQGQSFIEVKKPDEIEGVRVMFQDDGIELEYEGVSLETGLSEASAVSPVGALPELLRVWIGGIVSEQGKERIDGNECLLITHTATRNGAELQYNTWFDAESLKPIKAEIYENGYRKIICDFLIADKFE